MTEKTIRKRVDQMEKGDIIVKNRVVDNANGTFKIDVKNKVKQEVLEPYLEDKMVVKNLENNEIKVLHNFGWLEYDVLVPKKQKAKKC